MKKLSINLSILALALALPATMTQAAVNLVFASPTASATSGGTFNVTLNLQVTAGEQVTGVDYFLQELSAAGFSIIGRSITGSAFTDPYFTDTQVSSSSDSNVGGNPNGQPDNLLNPRNDLDLGAVTNPSGTTTGSGFVASFTLMAPTAAPGSQFTISTVSNPNTGWVGPGSAFTNHPFDNQGSFVVTIVPEPATWALLTLGGIASLGMNYLRRNRRS